MKGKILKSLLFLIVHVVLINKIVWGNENNMIDYQMIEYSNKKQLIIPCPYNSEQNQTKIFEDAWYGVQIDSIYADGKKIEPEKYVTEVFILPIETIFINKDKSYLYLLEALLYEDNVKFPLKEYWSFVTHLDSPDQGNLIFYPISRTAKDIIVKYQISFPDGTFSKNKYEVQITFK